MSPMKVIIAIGLVVMVALVVGLLVLMKGPDLKQYEALRTPRITTLAPQRMLVVEITGEPKKTAGEGIGLLFKAYFGSGGKMKGPLAPRARWPLSEDTPASQWVGRFAVPVGADFQLNAKFAGDSRIKIMEWMYGEVAEILHVGPYDAEKPTVEALKAFVAAQGYMIVGEHEEEYIKGPSLVGRNDPAKYYTVIRCQVAKAQG